MQKILLSGRNIEHAYQDGKIKTPVLKGINLDIEAAKITAIVGKSGSGKSTLLHILGTLDTPNSGQIFFQDIDISKYSQVQKARFRNVHLGFVYQFHHLLGDFTALENVMLPLLIDKVERNFAQQRATYLLERVGLGDLMHHLPSELSGGERQRVAIARALSHSPELILADEPTGNLDENNAKIVFDLFYELVRDEGTAVVMVTHDRALAQRCDHVLEMVDGLIIDNSQYGKQNSNTNITTNNNSSGDTQEETTIISLNNHQLREHSANKDSIHNMYTGATALALEQALNTNGHNTDKDVHALNEDKLKSNKVQVPTQQDLNMFALQAEDGKVN